MRSVKKKVLLEKEDVVLIEPKELFYWKGRLEY
jgi:translation initiation factor IF-1